MNTLSIVLGPTASGKSELAIQIAPAWLGTPTRLYRKQEGESDTSVQEE
jgi:hypothetical protein